MDFFCVRKPHHTREKHHRRGAKKREEKASIIRFEARPKDNNPMKNSERGRQSHRRSSAMVRPHASPPPADLSAPDLEQPYTHAYPRLPNTRPPTRDSNRDEYDTIPRASQGRAQETPQQPAQVRQFYVHPYSTQHCRFPVVDHSTACHGLRPAPYPAYYMALVPEVAAVRDIEDALVHRSGLVAMARLHAAGELVHISTFHTIRALHEASLQLEVWDSDNGATNARTPRNGSRG
ncbi:hypothetical protein F4859DRAFT_140652 [Xylaria cf. heliscus]|nr:hypothetical protein F4859DRAFT_140652 [Xylaria cf. heliscus]